MPLAHLLNHLPQTGNHIVLRVAGGTKSDYVRSARFFEFVGKMVILQ